MKTAIALRHVPFEDLAALEPLLAEHGYQARYVEAPGGGFEGVAEADLLVVLGGPISVNDGRDYPFVEAELALVAERLAKQQPILGVCLGAQFMAKALGARVYPMGYKEIGWSRLRMSEAGAVHPLKHLGEPGVEVLHWHGETFELPAGATLLASSERCQHQAFSYGPRALALQFHPEVTAHGLESWLVGHTAELSQVREVSIPALRAESHAKAPRLNGPLAQLVRGWLDGL